MMVNHRFLLGCILVSLFAVPGSMTQQYQSQLFMQSAAASLARNYEGGEVSWLLVNSSGSVISQHWEEAHKPVAIGSLAKPFLALAYGQQHNNAFPHVHCAGAAGHCWLPKGHGDIGLEEAIAQSCNSYFLSLAKYVDRTRASTLFASYGLNGPALESTDEAMIGLNGQWRETALSFARAYLQLVAEDGDPLHQRIIQGMELAAQHGTARGIAAAIGTRALAKTGTAVCLHHPRAEADGFAIVLYPATMPRLVLLARMHGATGARAAALAGQMLRTIGIGEAESAK